MRHTSPRPNARGWSHQKAQRQPPQSSLPAPRPQPAGTAFPCTNSSSQHATDDDPSGRASDDHPSSDPPRHQPPDRAPLPASCRAQASAPGLGSRGRSSRSSDAAGDLRRRAAPHDRRPRSGSRSGSAASSRSRDRPVSARCTSSGTSPRPSAPTALASQPPPQTQCCCPPSYPASSRSS